MTDRDTTESLEFALQKFFGRHGARPANLETKQRVREIAQWCADNGIEFIDVGSLQEQPPIVTDGGVDVGPASASDMDAAETPGDAQFAFQAMEKEDVSVSIEEDRYIVTVRGPDRGVVDGSPVVELVNGHGLVIKGVQTDVDTGELTLEVGH